MNLLLIFWSGIWIPTVYQKIIQLGYSDTKKDIITWPRVPIRFSAGTSASSKMTARVGCEFQPIFCSFLPKDKPANIKLGSIRKKDAN